MYQMKIASIVAEGTVVKEGEVVAELDRTGIASKMAEVSLALQKAEAVYEQAMLDSTLNLSKAREEIRTMELGLERSASPRSRQLRSAHHPAPGRDRSGEGSAGAGPGQVGLRHQDRAGPGQDAGGGGRPRRQKNKLKVVSDVMQGFTVKAPAPACDLLQGLDGKSGPPARRSPPGIPPCHPARSHPDGIGHLRERDRRAEVQVGSMPPSLSTPTRPRS